MTEQEIAALHEAIDSEVEWHLDVRWNERKRQFEIASLLFDLEFTTRVSDVVPKRIEEFLYQLNLDIRHGLIEDVLS